MHLPVHPPVHPPVRAPVHAPPPCPAGERRGYSARTRCGPHLRCGAGVVAVHPRHRGAQALHRRPASYGALLRRLHLALGFQMNKGWGWAQGPTPKPPSSPRCCRRHRPTFCPPARSWALACWPTRPSPAACWRGGLPARMTFPRATSGAPRCRASAATASPKRAGAAGLQLGLCCAALCDVVHAALSCAAAALGNCT